MGSSSGDQEFQIHSTFKTMCFPLMSPMFGYVLHHLTPEFQEAHPSSKGKDLLTASTTQHPKAKKENHLPIYKPFQSPRQRHSQKRPENPSGTTAAAVDHVQRGPRRDQKLDHGGIAVPSRHMQRRVASGARDATRTAGQLRLPSRNRAIVMGCFCGWAKCGYSGFRP